MPRISLPVRSAFWGTCACMSLVSPTYSGIQNGEVVFISPTTTLEAGRLCYSDGKGIACNSAAPMYNNPGGDLPTATVVAFDLPSCPAGWSAYSSASGRFVRGMDSAGTTDPSGTRVENSLQNSAYPSHTHTVDFPSTGTTAAGTHSHAFDPSSVSTSGGTSHSHSIPALSATLASAGAHTHTVQGNVLNNTSNGGAADRVVNFTGAGTSGTTGSSGTHFHLFSTTAGTSNASSSHTHTVDPANTGTTSTGHSHTLDIAATASTATGTVSETRPSNVALRFCRKD